MDYELSISRFGSFFDPVPAYDPPSDVITRFAQQIAKIVENPTFDETYDDILVAAHAAAPEAYYLVSKFESPDGVIEGTAWDPVEIVAHSDSEYTDDPPLVALLPSRKLALTLGEISWHVRIRASVTACALQRPERRAKIWWTFEAIPAEALATRRPDEKDVAHLVTIAETMNEAAKDRLRVLYRQALFEVAGITPIDGFAPNIRIRIHMADSEEPAVAALVQAMYLGDRTVGEIASAEPGDAPNAQDEALAEARSGLDELSSLLSHVLPLAPALTDQSVSVVSEVPGTRGIVYRHTAEDGSISTLAGVARRASRVRQFLEPSTEQIADERSEASLHVRSAARPISAHLADIEAKRLDRLHR